jgi:hypothetical protein
MTRCALCGHAFEPRPRDACAGCPLGARCAVTCCPRCGYSAPLPESSTLVRLIDRIFRFKEVSS